MRLYTLNNQFVASQYFRKLGLTVILLLLSACGGGGGSDDDNNSNENTVDTTPAAFTFEDQNDVVPDTTVRSNTITVSAIDVPISISISNGKYCITGGECTAAAGTISNGETLQLEVTAADTVDTTVAATLTLGTVSATFSVSTQSDRVAPAASIQFPPPLALTDRSTITLRGSASDDYSEITQLQVNGVDAETEDGFATWHVTVPLNNNSLNTLTVTTTDAAGNVDENAASVTITQNVDAQTSRIPNREPFFDEPNSIVLDSTNKRLLVADQSLDAIFSVDLVTGERTILSDNKGIGTGINFAQPIDIALDSDRNRLLVAYVDPATPGILSVNLSEEQLGHRERLDSSGSPDFIAPVGITLDFATERALVTDQALQAVVAVNLLSGERSYFAESNLFSPDFEPYGLTLNSAAKRLLIVDSDPANPTILALALSDLSVTTVSDNINSGTDLLNPNSILLGSDNDIWLSDYSNGVFKVTANGDRESVLANITGSVGLAWDSESNILYLGNSELDAILAVDPVSGEQVIFSR